MNYHYCHHNATRNRKDRAHDRMEIGEEREVLFADSRVLGEQESGESRVPSSRLRARLGCQREAGRQQEGGVCIWEF